MMTAAPDRTLQQRHDALEHANAVRTYRSALKRDVRLARVDADAVLVSGDPLVAAMKATDLLLAVPGMGPVKLMELFRRRGISPSKTVGGLAPRQRGDLLVFLRRHRSRSSMYAHRRELAEARFERPPETAA